MAEQAQLACEFRATAEIVELGEDRLYAVSIPKNPSPKSAPMSDPTFC